VEALAEEPLVAASTLAVGVTPSGAAAAVLLPRKLDCDDAPKQTFHVNHFPDTGVRVDGDFSF